MLKAVPLLVNRLRIRSCISKARARVARPEVSPQVADPEVAFGLDGMALEPVGLAHGQRLQGQGRKAQQRRSIVEKQPIILFQGVKRFNGG